MREASGSSHERATRPDDVLESKFDSLAVEPAGLVAPEGGT